MTKYKARLIVREDLQDMIDQNVYAVILTFKIFRVLITLIAVFNLKTQHLNLINAFLNVTNDVDIYCHLSNDYKIREKMLWIIKTLYKQRGFSLLWLRDLIKICLFMNLKSIFEEFYLFINEFFFYVNDIVFAYKKEKTKEINCFIERLANKYKLKVLKSMMFFLKIRVIHDKKNSTVNLIQNDYINKLTKIYQINISIKSFIISLSIDKLITHENEKDKSRIIVYRKKIKSVCYSTIIIRSDIVRIVLKLTKFLINLSSKYLNVVDHCLRYLHDSKFLKIEYFANKDKELMIQAMKIEESQLSIEKHIFEKTVDVNFANNFDQKSTKAFTFKLYDDLINWASRKQLTISTFVTKAKLLTLLHVDKQLIWWIHLFHKLKFNSRHQIAIHNDNLQIIRILTFGIDKTDTKLRHVHVAQCWLRQSIQTDYLLVHYLSTVVMTSDDFIKALPLQKHQIIIDQLKLKNMRGKILDLKDNHDD